MGPCLSSTACTEFDCKAISFEFLGDPSDEVFDVELVNVVVNLVVVLDPYSQQKMF